MMTFRIQGEKVPNRRGIERVAGLLGVALVSWSDYANSAPAAGTWVVGGYLSNWATEGGELPKALRGGYRVVQDILANPLAEQAEVLLPSAAWVEKSGSWENHQGRIQAFEKAINPPGRARAEGDAYCKLLNRRGGYVSQDIRNEIGEPFALVVKPAEEHESPAPAMEFVEL